MTNDLVILEDYINRCSNWGRWGPDDQLGTVNLITPDKVREAAALVKVGKSISLTMAYDALHCPKTLLAFTAAEGAEEHCHVGALTLFHQRMFDWLDDTLAS